MATPQEQLARIRKQAEALQGNVNTLADAKKGGMEQTGQTTVQDAQRFLNRPAPAPATTPDGSVEAETLTSGGTPTLPEPTATTEQEGFQAGLEASITSAKANLDNTLKTERDGALKRQETLNKQMESLIQKSDPTERGTFDQEQRIIQNQLDAAETASASLEEDFNKRRSVVGELDRLLTEGNQAIQQAQGMPVAMSVLNKSVTQTAQMVQARAGVLNAVISGLDGNVNAAHTIINNSSNAVAAVWNDQLAYNQAYMNLVGNGELAKNKIHDDYAQSQITLAESKLSQLEETKNYITELMIDPQSAQFIADAGITLNDSVDEINQKMATETKRVEREDVKNELLMEGYEYVPFPGDRDDVVTLDVGGQQMSFVPPVDEMEQAQIAATWALANQRSGGGSGGGGTGGGVQGGETFISPAGQVQVPTFEDFIAGKEEEMLMSMTPATREEFRKEYEDEVEVMSQAAQVASLSPLAQEVVNNPQRYYDFTPTARQDIFEEMANAGIDTRSLLSGKKKSLPATQTDNFSQARGVKNDVEKLYSMLQELPGTGPVGGRLQSLNPYHPKRVAIDAQITRIIPGLARGIFNEVGVLTDADMDRYQRTIANPNMTDEQIEQVHSDTLAKIDQSISMALETFGAVGYDVSGLQDLVGNTSSSDNLSDEDAYAEYLKKTGQ